MEAWPIEAIVQAVGWFGAIVAAALGYFARERRIRREHTVDMLLRLLINDRFSEGLQIVNEHVHEGKIIDARELLQNPERLKSINMLLGFYEFIAISHARKELDRDVIEQQRRTSLHDAWTVLEPLIRSRRDVWQRPTYMERLEELAGNLGRKYKLKNKVATSGEKDA